MPEYANLTGRFFRAGKEIEAPPYTRDPAVAARLWAACTALAGLEH